MSTGSPAQDQNFVRTSKFFSFCLDIYIYIKHIQEFDKWIEIFITKTV